MKTVAMISGKGGTGKTTVTALMARLAAVTYGVVLADADVEGSNLPIALGAAPEYSRPFPGVATAVVDAELCTGCGACATACRFGALATGGGGRMTVDALVCEGCGACVRSCAARAVELTPRDAGSVLVGRCALGPIAYGRLRPGHDLSGRLVTTVREMAARLATESGADLILVDGPPGTGCPAIAALSGVDLAVAVAEPSLSGAHDLDRVGQLARRLGTPLSVILNKADLSVDGAERIRGVCRRHGLELLAEVPFAPELIGEESLLAPGWSRLCDILGSSVGSAGH